MMNLHVSKIVQKSKELRRKKREEDDDETEIKQCQLQ